MIGGGGDGGTGRGYGSGSARSLAGPSSKVETGTITVSGLEQAAVSKLVARSRNQLRYCHEKELGSDPTVVGTLQLSLEVKGGEVESAVATGTSLPAALLRCVERSAKRWALAGAGTAAIALELSLEE